MSAEIIREKVMRLTQDELPHSVAVLMEKYEETPERTNIKAALCVNAESQKGMVIGNKGQMIKQIGTEARLDLEKLTGSKVFLDLQVRVRKNWRKDAEFLKSLNLATDFSKVGGKKSTKKPKA
jgi:GTP-binding protein Era